MAKDWSSLFPAKRSPKSLKQTLKNETNYTNDIRTHLHIETYNTIYSVRMEDHSVEEKSENIFLFTSQQKMYTIVFIVSFYFITHSLIHPQLFEGFQSCCWVWENYFWGKWIHGLTGRDKWSKKHVYKLSLQKITKWKMYW